MQQIREKYRYDYNSKQFEMNEEKKVVKSKKFGERGMLTFPAPLLKLVRSELRHANTYDRLLDKYFEHVEEKSWNEHV